MNAVDAPDAKLAQRRQEALTRLTPESVAWLTLPPVWTTELARLAGFAATDLPAVLAEGERLGWCVRRSAAHGLGAREAAELLIDLAVRLRTDRAGGDVVARVVQAAEGALAVLPSARHRARLAARLASGADPGAEAATEVEPEAEPSGPEPTEQVRRAIDGGDTSTAARLVADLAPRLPRQFVLSQVRALAARLADPEESPVAAIYLAGAAAVAGDVALALSVGEQVTEPRIRVCALAEVAVRLAAAGEQAQTRRVVALVVDALDSGTRIDLMCAADAAERLVGTGQIEPVFARVARVPSDQLGARDLGALVRLATAARAAGASGSADAITLHALDLAQRQRDASARATALVQVLPVVEEPGRGPLAVQAWAAIQEMTDQAQRARALGALVPMALRHGTGDGPLDELLELCRPKVKDDTFWTPDITRTEVLGALEERQGPGWLRRIAAQIGAEVCAAPARRAAPDATLRWATLAAMVGADETGGQAGATLLDKVEHSVSSGSAAEAGGWVLAGRRLLAVVRGAFETSLLLAVRRVELVNRREHDRRLLSLFLPRAEQLEAFDRLVGGADRDWALHYLGYGGVGKTMLLRYLCSHAAPQRGWLPARVDFDHLNPEFPWRRPGQLLLELLEELEAYAPTQASSRYYQEAREHLRHLEWWHDPAARRPDLSRAVERFCAYAESLPQPVLIVLDTCEELEKFQPVNAALPQLDAAFELLEAVHQRVPSVRVVFGGRRPLARSGAGGWRINPDRVQPHLPHHKDYLAVQVIQGFSSAEARTYLSTIEKLTLDEPTVGMVLERSVEPHQSPYLLGVAQAGGRYNPFDLSLYAALLREDPASVRHDQAATSYLNNRVVARLGSGAPLLPAAVAMRRFDHDMLAAAAAVVDVPLDEVWPQFAGAEWVLSRLDPAVPDTFLEIDPGLLGKLAAYYGDGPPRLAYDHAVRELAPRLAALVRGRRPTALAVAHVEAALRCAAPGDAATLCDDLALRVVQDDAWMWAFTVFGRLLNAEGALGAARHPARAGALALYATAAAHLHPHDDHTETWREVWATAEYHPVAGVRDWLRARAGVLSRPDAVDPLVQALRHAVTSTVDGPDRDERRSWLLGTILVGAERLMDAVEDSRLVAAELAPLVDELRDVTAPTVASIVTAIEMVRTGTVPATDRRDDEWQILDALLSRLYWLYGNLVAARWHMDRALRRLADHAATASAYLAADRPTPISWRSRVRLRAVALALGEPQRHWLDDALADGVAQPDSDRLASTLLDGWLDAGPVARDLLMSIERAVADHRPPTAVAAVHRRVPPLRVSLARGWLALGEARHAQTALGPKGSYADGPAEQRALDLARVEISRRMRLADADRRVRVSLLGSELSYNVRARAVEATALLEGPPRLDVPSTDSRAVHLWWRSRIGLPEPGRLLAAVQSAGEPHDPSPAEPALALDAAELDLLRRRPSEARRLLEALQPESGETDTDLRLALRRSALLGDAAVLRRLPPGRRAAELGLEEGELLALRLPALAQPLLTAAADAFQAAGDPVGRLVATIAAGLASLHVAETLDPDTRVRLADAYRAAADDGTGLPPWEHLLEGAGDPADPAGATSDPPDWSGWLLRLRWLLARPDSKLRRQLASAPEATVPPELRMHPEQRASATEPTQPPVSPPGYSSTPEHASWPQREYSFPPSGPTRSDRVRWTAMDGITAVLGYVADLVAGRRRNDRRAEVGAAESDVDGVLTLRATAVRPRRGLLPRLWTTFETTATMPTGVPREQVRALIPIIADVASPGQVLPVGVRVPLALAPLCWEAALIEPLVDRFQVQPWRAYDPLQVARTDGVAPREPAGRITRVAVPEQWAALVDTPGTPRSREAGATKAVRLGSLAELGDGDVAVVMATAVDTSTGRLLAVRVSKDRQVVIQPDELDARDVLLVVCGEPGSHGRSEEADRLATRDLRGCAADLMEAGAGAVVLLPSMPERFLRQSLDRFGVDLPHGRALLSEVYAIGALLRAGGLADIATETTVLTRGL